MLKSSKQYNESHLPPGTRIPVSQNKRSKSFRMSDNRKDKFTSYGFSRETAPDTSSVLEISHFQKGNVELQRNIEADVFDWLSRNAEASDKYTERLSGENRNVVGNTQQFHRTNVNGTLLKNSKEELQFKEMVTNGTGTTSYFNVFKNAFFPFEGKYFYLSGEKNKQKVSLTETTKTISDNSAQLLEKTKIIGESARYLMDKTSCSDDRYKEILGNERVDNDMEMPNNKWENNRLKDTKVYYEDQRVDNGEHKNGYGKYQHQNTTGLLKFNHKSDACSYECQQKEINRLRTQVEKLSSFVESSDECREQSEAMLAEKQEEVLKHIREKEALDNRVCCLEELIRNLQRKIEEITENNKSLKLALKSNEEKLFDEQEKVEVLKKECSNEIAKNVELELVLQTIREELGCGIPAKNQDDADSTPCAHHVERKVHWSDVQTQETTKTNRNTHFNAEQQLWGTRTTSLPVEAETSQRVKTQYSCLKKHPSEETQWRKEKKQFEGKIMLLEMDKKKLRSQMEVMAAKILKQENIAQSLRENNEILEFRILELEYELLDKAKK